MKRYTLLIGFVACMSVSLMHAQQDGSQLLFERFENRFQELDSLMFTSSEYSVLDDSTIFFSIGSLASNMRLTTIPSLMPRFRQRCER